MGRKDHYGAHLSCSTIPVQPLVSRVWRDSLQLLASTRMAESVTRRMPCRERDSSLEHPLASAHTPASLRWTHHVRLASLRLWHAPRDPTAASASCRLINPSPRRPISQARRVGDPTAQMLEVLPRQCIAGTGIMSAACTPGN